MGLQEDRGIEAALRLQKGQQTLTLEQVAEARRFAEERIRAQLDTAPVDEGQAEDFLWQAYAAAGLAPPRHIHWLDGPLELIAAVGRNDQSIEIDDIYSERIAHCVWDDMARETDEVSRLRIGIAESVDCRVRNVQRNVEKRHRGKFGHYYWNKETLAAKIWRVVTAPALDRIKYTVGEALARAVSISFTHPNTDRPWRIDRIWARYESEHETYRWLSLCSYDAAPHLAYLEYFHSYYAPNEAHALAQLTPLVSGYWLGKTVALVVRKPTILSRDVAGQPHSTTGPAVQYADGWGFWARHGVHVPAWVAECPAEELTRDDFFAASNAEVRRVIQERMGERFLWTIGARFINSGPRSILYEVDLPYEHEPVARYVELRDSSSERIYYLRVPPTIQTAEEAVAWTFGLNADEYGPAQES
jgi:hypothetical protein